MSVPIPYLVTLVPYSDLEKQRRQEVAAESIDRVGKDFLRPINFCVAGEEVLREGWMIDPTLRWVTLPEGGARKLPLVRDLFDQAAAIAEIHGSEWFAVANSDIILTEAWKARVEELIQGEDEVIIFPRTDFDRDQKGAATIDLQLFHRGQDLYLCRVATWERIRSHFNSYIFGEAYWDNIFTAIFLMYAKGFLCMEQPGLCLHERHSRVWGGSPFYLHNQLLANGPDMIATLRWKYFHLGLFLRQEDHGRGLNEAELRQLIADMFIRPLSEELEFSEKMALRSQKQGLNLNLS